MDEKDVFRSQYHAALEMMRQTAASCPADIWNSPDDSVKFWHIAYHALFYTHLYLQQSEEAFVPWEKHRLDYQFMGQVPHPPHTRPVLGEPFSQAEVLEYLSFCHEQVEICVPSLNLTGESGFYWLPFDKRELQLYNIRHLQQHTGELMERLGTRAGIELNWVGKVHTWPLEPEQ